MELRKVLRVPKGRPDVITALLRGIEADMNAGGTWHVRSGSSMRAPAHLVGSDRVAQAIALCVNRTEIAIAAAQNGNASGTATYSDYAGLLASGLLPEEIRFETGVGWNPDGLPFHTVLELCCRYVGEGFRGLLRFSTASETWVWGNPRADVDIGFCHEVVGTPNEPHWNFVMITATGDHRTRLGPVLKVCKVHRLVEHVPARAAA